MLMDTNGDSLSMEKHIPGLMTHDAVAYMKWKSKISRTASCVNIVVFSD